MTPFLPINLTDLFTQHTIESERVEYKSGWNPQSVLQNGSPLAEFDFDEDHSYFMVRLPVHPAALAVRSSLMTQSDDSIERLLRVLVSGPLSAGGLRQALGIRHRQTFRENYLHVAIEEQFIEYTIPDKPSSRLQKYQLTDKGLQCIHSRS